MVSVMVSVMDDKPELFLPHYLVVAYRIMIPKGWVFDLVHDGWTPAPTADATVPASDAAVSTEQVAVHSTTPTTLAK